MGLLKEKEIQYTISLDESFESSIHSSNQTLLSGHFVYKKHKRNVAKYCIQWLLNDVHALSIYHGIFDDEVQKHGTKSYSKRLIVLSIRDQEKTFNKVYSKNCHLLVNFMNICQECRNSQSSIKSKLAATRKAIGKPVLSKSPLSKVSKQRLAVAVHTLLEKQKKLEARVNQLGKEISIRGVTLGEVVHSDSKMLVDNAAADTQENSFQNLFRKE